jgi:hypothetical protein
MIVATSLRSSALTITRAGIGRNFGFFSRLFGKSKNAEKKNGPWWNTMPEHEMVFDPVTMMMAHPMYDTKNIEKVDITHKKARSLGDLWAYFLTRCLRFFFDRCTFYSTTRMTEKRWFRRIIFLETIAGVPGFVAGMCRHLKCIRDLRKDDGWINHLLGEAENERQHLLTFMYERNPGRMFRLVILLAQGVFMNCYFVSYLIAPKVCHRFTGYLEEQAVITYTHLLKEIDEGKMKEWGSRPTTKQAIQYWGLRSDATWRDVVLAIRADEAIHRDFNHHLAEVDPSKPMEVEPVIIKSPYKHRYEENKKRD